MPGPGPAPGSAPRCCVRRSSPGVACANSVVMTARMVLANAAALSGGNASPRSSAARARASARSPVRQFPAASTSVTRAATCPASSRAASGSWPARSSTSSRRSSSSPVSGYQPSSGSQSAASAASPARTSSSPARSSAAGSGPARTQVSTAATACGHGAPSRYGAGQAQRASRPEGLTRTLTSMPSTIASICGPTAENPATLSASVTACAKTASSTALCRDSSVTSICAIRRHPGVSRWRIRSCPSASSSVGSRGPVSFPISSW